LPGKFRILAVIVFLLTLMIPVFAVLPFHLHGEKEKKEIVKVEKIAKEKENKVTKGEKIKKEKKKEQAEEIIRFSKLEKEMKKFAINRDVFSPSPIKPINPAGRVKLPPLPPPQEIKKKAEEEKEKDIEDEIRRSLFFEGYVIKNSKNHALVSVNGEFFAVAAGDMVLEKITIIKIEKKTIKVEVDAKVFEIQLKGDNEDEKQDAQQ